MFQTSDIIFINTDLPFDASHPTIRRHLYQRTHLDTMIIDSTHLTPNTLRKTWFHFQMENQKSSSCRSMTIFDEEFVASSLDWGIETNSPDDRWSCSKERESVRLSIEKWNRFPGRLMKAFDRGRESCLDGSLTKLELIVLVIDHRSWFCMTREFAYCSITKNWKWSFCLSKMMSNARRIGLILNSRMGTDRLNDQWRKNSIVLERGAEKRSSSKLTNSVIDVRPTAMRKDSLDHLRF